MLDMRRRERLTLIGGVAAWPVVARAQPRERMRRIGILMTFAADDLEGPFCSCRRPRAQTGERDCHDGWPAARAGSAHCNIDNSDRVHERQ